MTELKIIESREGETVSPELRLLLEAVYEQIGRTPSDLGRLKESLERLLLFLISPHGRTNANCWAADLFFCLRDDWSVDWDHLPERFGDILSDLGGALHDTVETPDIAQNFDSTPEQLLARLRTIEVSSGTG